MLEREIERYFCEGVKRRGGLAYKFVSPGNAGVPDRLVVLPPGVIIFAEIKAPGKKPTELQRVQHRRLGERGMHVLVIDSKERVDEILARFDAWKKRGEEDGLETVSAISVPELLH